jgi:peptidase M28-like protein
MTESGISVAVLPAEHAREVRTASPAVHWAQLGERTVVWSPAGELPERAVAAASAAGLALVTQVGRAFQDEHPKVRVVLDHGRHLVVDTATLPEKLAVEDVCWRVDALPADMVVVDRPALRPGRTDPLTVELLGQLFPSAFDSDLKELVGFGTRHSLSSGFDEAAEWAADRFMSLGYTVAEQSIAVGSGRSRNVIADLSGLDGDTDNLVLVTAHLDSVNLVGGAAAPAPGADDNGSGSAGVLELARVLASTAWESNLRLILFGGEEQGLHGSRQHVAGLTPEDRARIRAVLNMDMVATRNTAEPAVLLEGAPVSQQLIDDLAAAAATYTGLRVETSLKPFASDHVPFIDAGAPAVLSIEGADSANGNIHTAADTLDHIDLELMLEILRMNAAALVGWLHPAVQRP